MTSEEQYQLEQLDQYQLERLAWPCKQTAHFLLITGSHGRFGGFVHLNEETFEAAISSAFGHIKSNPNISRAMLYKISEERHMDIKGYRELEKGEEAERKLYELLKEKYGS